MTILSIDLGGTTAKVGLVVDGKITERTTIKTEIGNIFQNIFDNLGDIDYKDADAISVCSPGFINGEERKIVLAGNLELKDFDINSELKRIFGKEAYVVNDANAATLGEVWKGAGSQYNSLAFYTIGTGVGGGLFINDQLVTGENGYAGEFGHAGFFQEEVNCTCGLENCLEPVSSATGIERLLKKEFGDEATIKDYAEKFISGDETVRKIFEHALTPLARHISIIQTAVNPSVIVIGGGPSAIGDPLADFIATLVKKYQLDFIADSTPIRIATTGNDAGMLGAAYYAIKEMSKNGN